MRVDVFQRLTRTRKQQKRRKITGMSEVYNFVFIKTIGREKPEGTPVIFSCVDYRRRYRQHTALGTQGVRSNVVFFGRTGSGRHQEEITSIIFAQPGYEALALVR